MGREFFLSSLLAGTPPSIAGYANFQSFKPRCNFTCMFQFEWTNKGRAFLLESGRKARESGAKSFFFLDFYLGMLACLPAAFSFSKKTAAAAAAAAEVWVGGGARAREGEKRRGKKSHFHIRFPERTHKRKEEGK